MLSVQRYKYTSLSLRFVTTRMKTRTIIRHTFLVSLISLLLFGCKKEQILSSGGSVQFSVDTLMFDTVFTSLGSFTASVKIYNPQNQPVKLSSVRLEKGSSSYFNLNVNGVPGNVVTDIEVAAKDSIYVFATVNIDPSDEDVPFIVQDDLIATLNGQEFSVPFVAYGQNAYYIVDSLLPTQTWKTDKPYVIINNAYVDEGATLTLPAGCRVYVHANSRLYVIGTLNINGTKGNEVVFQGDRLDRKYFGNEGYPGEWGGLYFTQESTNNKINYAILKNCGNSTPLNGGSVLPAAIQLVDTIIDGNDIQLDIRNTIIENSIGYGILCFTSTVYAQNCLINNCGAQALGIFQGGLYEFNNCDFIVYGNNKVSHIENPTVAILNYFDVTNTLRYIGDLKATLRNCVIWGSLQDELFTRGVDGALYDLTLDHCLVKIKDTIPTAVTQVNTLLNQEPKFENYSEWNFKPTAGSPLINAGVAVTGLTTDIDGKGRDAQPDIGCYEF